MNRYILLSALLAPALFQEISAHAAPDSRGNDAITTFTNSPTSLHIAAFNSDPSVMLNIAQVSDTDGANNQFLAGFGAVVDRGLYRTLLLAEADDIPSYDEYGRNIVNNRVVATAINSSRNNSLITYIGHDSTDNAVTYNLNGAIGANDNGSEKSLFYTVLSMPHTLGPSVAQSNNTVTLNLNGDVRANKVFTYIYGLASNNAVTNTLTNTQENYVDTWIGTGPITQNTVTNTLTNTLDNNVWTAFSHGTHLNSLQTSITGGSLNDILTGFGAEMEFGRPEYARRSENWNISSNRVVATLTNSVDSTVFTHIGDNSVGNRVTYNFNNNLQGYFHTDIQAFPGRPGEANQAANNRVNFYGRGDLRGNSSATVIYGSSSGNTITNSTINTQYSIVVNQVGDRAAAPAVENNTIYNSVGTTDRTTQRSQLNIGINSGSRGNIVSNRVTGNDNKVATAIDGRIELRFPEVNREFRSFAIYFDDPRQFAGNTVSTTVTGDKNTAATQINGNANRVTTVLTSSGLLANDLGNAAELSVEGNSNTVGVTSSGKNNTATVSILGSYNYGGNVTGGNTTTSQMITQSGAGNRAVLTINGSNDMGYVKQTGNNNNASLSMNCSKCYYGLTQQGNNMTANVVRTK
jgi:hypothetical protein